MSENEWINEMCDNSDTDTFILTASDAPVLPDKSNEITLNGGEFIFDLSPAKPIEISIKPMLFYGSNFYPSGGWDDFQGYFDTVEEAEKDLLKQDPLDRWGHIVKDGKIVKRFRCDGKFKNNEFSYSWEEEGLDE